MNTPPMLGETLRFTRHEARKTLKDIEAETGISNAYLSQLENGKILTPGPDKLARLAGAYGVPYNLLMIIAGHKPISAPDLTLDVPLFVLEASKVMQADDWELLRPIIGHLVKARRENRANAAD